MTSEGQRHRAEPLLSAVAFAQPASGQALSLLAEGHLGDGDEEPASRGEPSGGRARVLARAPWSRSWR